ncbi:hypothetical protein ABK249_31005 [Neorhizobium sp. Rsf11]|uniref:Uncharacterized protein n=1 Tax=Neorhizobium phenanthreniclasticum TaxID=3157917 RepID=A0ABV0ME05_9HYPH
MAYMKSSAFTSLDETTQTKRRSIIESMWEEPLSREPKEKRKMADVPMGSITAGHVEALRDRKKETPFAADERLKVLRQIFDTKDAKGKPYIANVARMVEALPRPDRRPPHHHAGRNRPVHRKARR